MSVALIEELAARGTLKQTTTPDNKTLGEWLDRQSPKPAVYCGYDPTGDSLHIGNLVTLVALERFRRAGYPVVALVGGATGMIGDPSGRSEERNLLDDSTLAANLAGIERDVRAVMAHDAAAGAGVSVLNNLDWVRSLSAVTLLRDIGTHFRVNAMLQTDSVRDRLDREDGLSFTEFSYSLIQAYDFHHLHRHHGVRLQIGGSDQWGNITAGTHLIGRLARGAARDEEKTATAPGSQALAHGLTLNLLLDDAGKKFGKSTGGGGLFLSPKHTSPYRLYQHFLNASDTVDEGSEAERYLKIFTFLSLDQIAAIMREHNPDRPARLAQRRLAEEVTRMVHGPAGVLQAERATEVLFGRGVDVRTVDDATLASIYDDVPHAEISRASLAGQGTTAASLFVAVGFCTSNGEARRLIKGGGARLDEEWITDHDQRLTADALGERQYVAIRSGKKNFGLLRIVD